MIKLLKIYICKRGSAEDGLEVYEHRADHLSNNLRSNETLYLPFSTYTIQLEIVVKATYE